MGGIEFDDGELLVERDPNELDELAIEFTAILNDLDIQHVYVAGYIAILTGRSRATEDVDVLIERLDESRITRLVDRLTDEGMWGPAMPLDDMYDMLANGDNIWIAPDDQVIPHIEAKFVRDESDLASLQNAITAHIADADLPIGPLEIGIAYKLYLGSQKDFEDAVHLYTLFEETLRSEELERWVKKLGVESDYERLRTA